MSMEEYWQFYVIVDQVFIFLIPLQRMIYTQLCIIHTLSLSPVLSYEHCGIHHFNDS
jgi:hypothetical protein